MGRGELGMSCRIEEVRRLAELCDKELYKNGVNHRFVNSSRDEFVFPEAR
jgi:hypothetical protein